ncbi:MFS general substrate transporter [Cucurbitaria berberidis CBS 394.84]|uniref:MFS general substrate transporter n=1 Tax=Cucurbitaria berberidis CBS 394.84 TaxID=1168544 RepID=A0A9P4GGU0_9PLEO|nr:MFS general substrate transporter [Cucurbitaria berberidis CBS 394.84]KAF1844974.1 MFS general substrate transporter [Cucurbitaria berberidis CBS 394.84]
MAKHENVELIPGTEIMDEDGTAKKTLVPKPSSDPQDPLNWSTKWKLTVMASQWLFTWISVTGALSIAPMFPLLGKEFHLNNNQLSMLTGITVITLGFANFIIVPLSNIFGRRAISLVFSVLIMLTCIWQALATSHRSLLAARAMNGLVCATSESIPVQMIADVFFLHERGLWTGVYFTGYFLGAFLGPVMAGTIAAHHRWQSFFWLETALSGVAIILVAIAFPETKYHRNRTAPKLTAPIQTTHQDGSGTVTSDDEGKLEKQMTHAAHHDSESTSLDAPTTVQGRPSRSQFMPFQAPDPRWKMFVVRDTWTPIKVFFNPIILWAGLMLAGPADLVLFFNITESPILAAPPYLFRPDQVGYTNFAFVVGALIGLATAGPYSDWVAARATRKNGGVREAEMRLPALWFYMIITVLSLILGGIAYQRQWAWGHIVVWGYGLAGLSVTTVPTISIAYAIDCYKPISGEIMVVATVCKNFIAFSYSYWVFDLAHESKDGWITPAMVIFACTVGPALFAFPLYYGLGKRIRRWTKASDVHRMEEMI